MPLALELVRSLALFLVGIYAGGVLFLVLAPTASQLPGPVYVRQWQALNTDYARSMPPLLLISVVALIAASILSRDHGPLVFSFCVGALVLVALVIVITVAVMEPLNRIADSWNPDLLPEDWQQLRARWIGLHLVRTVLGVAAFGSLILSQILDR